MKYSNANNSAHPRKQKTTISSTVVRCICITASCVVTACGLLGLGVTCYIIRLVDPSAAPCPFLMTIIVFGVAGLLFATSFVSLVFLCIRRNRMRNRAMLEDLPAACEEQEQLKQDDEDEEIAKDEEKEKLDHVNSEEPQGNEENYNSQKSADVSLWIEQQKSTESAVDCYSLENRDGVTSHDTDSESSEAEITPL